MKVYRLGINNVVFDEWTCASVDEQYDVMVQAETEDEAKEKAMKLVRKKYKGLLVSDYLEVAWIEEQK